LEPRCLPELGMYCGYGALRMARVMPEQARLRSIEFSKAHDVLEEAAERRRVGYLDAEVGQLQVTEQKAPAR